MVDPGSILDPYSTPTTLVDGAVSVRVDDEGRAYVVFYQKQLEPDGNFVPVLAARLVMSRDTMREIADKMQTSCMLASYRSERDLAQLKRKLT